MEYEKSIRIQADPEKVWSVLMDDDPQHNWKSLESQLDGVLAPGELLKVRHHRLVNRLLTIRCVDLEKGRRLALSFQMRLFPSQGSISWTLAPSTEDTLATIKISAQGPFVSFVKKFVDTPVNGTLDQVLQSVKRRAEGTA